MLEACNGLQYPLSSLISRRIAAWSGRGKRRDGPPARVSFTESRPTHHVQYFIFPSRPEFVTLNPSTHQLTNPSTLQPITALPAASQTFQSATRASDAPRMAVSFVGTDLLNAALPRSRLCTCQADGRDVQPGGFGKLLGGDNAPAGTRFLHSVHENLETARNHPWTSAATFAGRLPG